MTSDTYRSTARNLATTDTTSKRQPKDRGSALRVTAHADVDAVASLREVNSKEIKAEQSAWVRAKIAEDEAAHQARSAAHLPVQYLQRQLAECGQGTNAQGTGLPRPKAEAA